MNLLHNQKEKNKVTDADRDQSERAGPLLKSLLLIDEGFTIFLYSLKKKISSCAGAGALMFK